MGKPVRNEIILPALNFPKSERKRRKDRSIQALVEEIQGRMFMETEPESIVRYQDILSGREQEQVFAERRRVFGEIDIPDVLPLSIEEYDDLSISGADMDEVRNVELIKEFGRRKRNVPNIPLPVGTTIEVINKEMERILREGGPLREPVGGVGTAMGVLTSMVPPVAMLGPDIERYVVQPVAAGIGAAVAGLGVVAGSFEELERLGQATTTEEVAKYKVAAGEDVLTGIINAIRPGFEESNKEFIRKLSKNVQKEGLQSFVTTSPDNWPTTRAWAETDYPFLVKGFVEGAVYILPWEKVFKLATLGKTGEALKLINESPFKRLTAEEFNIGLRAGKYKYESSIGRYIDTTGLNKKQLYHGYKLSKKEAMQTYHEKLPGAYGKASTDELASMAATQLEPLNRVRETRRILTPEGWATNLTPEEMRNFIFKGDVARRVHRRVMPVNEASVEKVLVDFMGEGVVREGVAKEVTELLQAPLGKKGTDSLRRLVGSKADEKLLTRLADMSHSVDERLMKEFQDLLGVDRLNAALPQIATYANMGYPLIDAHNLKQMVGGLDAIGAEVASRNAAWYQKILRRDAPGVQMAADGTVIQPRLSRWVGNPVDFIFGTHMKFSDVTQRTVLAREAMRESGEFLILAEGWKLRQRLGREFGGKQFSGSNVSKVPSISTSIEPNSRMVAYWRQLDAMSDLGTYIVGREFKAEETFFWQISKKEAELLKAYSIFEEPQMFKFIGSAGRKQLDVVNDVQTMFGDLRMIEKWGFKQNIDEIAGNYLPHVFKIQDELPVIGKLRTMEAEGVKRIGGTQYLTPQGWAAIGFKESFEKTRQWPTMRVAIENTRIPLRLQDGVESVADLIEGRWAASVNSNADRFFLNELKRLGVSESETAMVKTALGGRSLPVTKVAAVVPSMLRLFKFAWDVGVLGVQSPASLTYLLEDPRAVATMWGDVLRYVWTEDGFRKWMVMNEGGILEAKRAGLHFGARILERETGSIIERGWWGYPVRKINDLQFTRGMTMLKYESWKINREILYNGSVINRSLGLKDNTITGGGMDYYSASRAAAAHVDEIFGGLGDARSISGASRRDFQRALLLTPQFLNATLSVIARPVTGGISAEALLARQFALKFYLVFGGLLTVAQLATDGTFPNVTDPTESDFFVWKGEEDEINVAGRWGTLAKYAFSPLKDIGEIRQGEWKDDKSITEHLVASNTVSRLQRFTQSRASIPISTGITVKTQRNFLGDPAWKYGEAGPGFNLTTGAMLALHLIAPISGTQFVEDWRHGETTMLQSILYPSGVSSWPKDLVRENVQRIIKDELITRYGATPESVDLALKYYDYPKYVKRAVDGGQIVVGRGAEEGQVELSNLRKQVAARAGVTEKMAAMQGFEAVYTAQDFNNEIEAQKKMLMKFYMEDIPLLEKETYDDISKRFMDFSGEAVPLTIQDVFKQIGEFRRSLSMQRHTLETYLTPDAIARMKEKSKTGTRTDKELLWILIDEIRNATILPSGRKDYDFERKLLAQGKIDLVNSKEDLAMWDEYFESRWKESEYGLVRLYDWVHDTARPYFDAKYEVDLSDKQLKLYDTYMGLADDAQLQTRYKLGLRSTSPNDLIALDEAIRKVEYRQIQYTRPELWEGRDLDLSPNDGGVAIELALFLLMGKKSGPGGSVPSPGLRSIIMRNTGDTNIKQWSPSVLAEGLLKGGLKEIEGFKK